jgi:hypothetical protein
MSLTNSIQQCADHIFPHMYYIQETAIARYNNRIYSIIITDVTTNPDFNPDYKNEDVRESILGKRPYSCMESSEVVHRAEDNPELYSNLGHNIK